MVDVGSTVEKPPEGSPARPTQETTGVGASLHVAEATIVPPLLRFLKASILPYGVLFRERRVGVIILIYHRVHGGTSSEIDLPRHVFARQMAYLRAHYPVISLDALTHGTWTTGRHDSDVVAVTFDDGCRDIYEHAFPILLEHSIPATIYLATHYIESQEPFDFGGYARQRQRPRPLTWWQLRTMIASGLITVGAHTHSHVDLTRLSLAAAREEVDRSRRFIEYRLGVRPRHFAYPWGRVNPTVKSIVGEQFATAVRGGCGKNPFDAVDFLSLWRQPIQQSDGVTLFRLKVRSYLDGEEYLRGLAARLRRTPATDARA